MECCMYFDVIVARTLFLIFRRFWVYLGVRTCELFLCFVLFVCLGFIVVDFFVFFVLRHR